ncbi:MAG TPA: sensor histidine kinase [Azoarcus sp.]|nr:sensor histidine kinase [Azoarcus sp.]
MRLRRRKSDSGAKQEKARQPNSLFGEILDWLLAPLLVLWPISIIFTHSVASNIANQPYDLILADNVRALSRLVQVTDGVVWVDFPASPRIIFRSDREDVFYYQVATGDGTLASGDSELPRIAPPVEVIPEQVLFRDAYVQGEQVRVAYQFLQPHFDVNEPMVVVQVAETLNKRSTLSSRVVTEVLFPQFAIIPLAVLLVWVGLSRGTLPLSRLEQRIASRRPTDLSPIEPSSAPDEARPLIVSFNDMMARLDENLQAQQRFIADAAHQMRTPLTGLRTQTELARDETDPAQLRRSLEQITESAQRATHLINQLLLLARAENTSESIYVMERVDLGAIVRAVAAELFPMAQEKDLDFGVEGGDHDVEVRGNTLLLGEMIKNLLDNAIKYTPCGGKVTARMLTIDDTVRLEVEDDGVGIPAADRERVFERFYRVLESGEEGSGLGLSIVREIAELHGARISLEDGSGGRGTRARVDFDLWRPPYTASKEKKDGDSV